jgi:DNA-binding winged helix-turn-helix (wHTH) protein
VEKAIQNAQVLRFATFEVDLRSGEVRKGGIKVKLSGQSFQVLAILLECPGQIVTREEFQKQLWPETFVDVDHSLNTAINKIREVLGDSAEHPRYVETLSRRGYRFIAPVNGSVATDQFTEKIAPGILNTGTKPLHYRVLIIGFVLVTVAGLALWESHIRTPRAPRVLRFTQLTNDGQAKMGQLVTDGSRIYFNEVLPDLRTFIAQVSVKGGEAIPLAMRIKRPLVLDLSKAGTDLLVANVDREGAEGNSFWVQPVAGGSARRVGSVVGFDARFGVDASSIIYSTEHDVYSLRRLPPLENLPGVNAPVGQFVLVFLPLRRSPLFERDEINHYQVSSGRTALLGWSLEWSFVASDSTIGHARQRNPRLLKRRTP